MTIRDATKHHRVPTALIVGFALGWLVATALRPGPSPTPPAPPLQRPLSAFREQMRRARDYQKQAWHRRDPGLVDGTVMADDATDSPSSVRSVDPRATALLDQAREAVRRAAALAQTTDEKRLAGLLRSQIECQRGNNQEELRLAKDLLALAPDCDAVLSRVLVAAHHNQQADLEREMRQRLEARREQERTAGGPNLSTRRPLLDDDEGGRDSPE